MVIEQTAQEEDVVCHIACPTSQLLPRFPPTSLATARCCCVFDNNSSTTARLPP